MAGFRPPNLLSGLCGSVGVAYCLPREIRSSAAGCNRPGLKAITGRTKECNTIDVFPGSQETSVIVCFIITTFEPMKPEGFRKNRNNGAART